MSLHQHLTLTTSSKILSITSVTLLLLSFACGKAANQDSVVQTIDGKAPLLEKYSHIDEFNLFENEYPVESYIVSDGNSRLMHRFLGQDYNSKFPFVSCFAIRVTEQRRLSYIFNEKNEILEGSKKDVLLSSSTDLSQLYYFKDCADRTRPSQRFYLLPLADSENSYFIKPMSLDTFGQPLPVDEKDPILGEIRIDMKRAFSQVEPSYLCGLGADITSLESIKKAMSYEDKCNIVTEANNENLAYFKKFLAINKIMPVPVAPVTPAPAEPVVETPAPTTPSAVTPVAPVPTPVIP